MEKLWGKTSKIIWMFKALLCAYVATGIMLLILTLLLYKMDLNEQSVSIAIIAVYVIATFLGGLIIGKLTKNRKFIWGLALGVAYFALLLLVSLGLNRALPGNGSSVVTSFLLCAGGGMLGGMIS